LIKLCSDCLDSKDLLAGDEMTLKEKIIQLLGSENGLTDREITDRLLGNGAQQQPINQACRSLENKGILKRDQGEKNRIQNYITSGENTMLKSNNEELDINIANSENSEYVCTLGELQLKELTLKFSKFDLINVFSGLKNKSVKETILKKRYLKFQDEIRQRDRDLSEVEDMI